jgi:dihydrofolate reductase
MYTAVAAMDKNRVIGRSVDDQIPWRFSKDFAWFKKQTLNKTVIM